PCHRLSPPPPQPPGAVATPGSLDLLDLVGNLSWSYYDSDSDGDNGSAVTYPDYDDATPCHNPFCPLFQRVAPPFLAATSAAAALATGSLLVALTKRPRGWRWPQNRALVAQLALSWALFAALLPPLAAGVARGWHLGTAPCRLTHLAWHWSVFSQALLVASGSFSSVWARWDPPSRRWAVALWATSLILATPAALVSGVAAGSGCVRRAVAILSPVYLLHLALCVSLLLLLPAGLVLATLAGVRAGRRAGAGLCWALPALWAPFGAGLAAELLLQAGLLEQSCGSFERFDLIVGVSEGLGVLHCAIGPLATLAVGWR
ncbi:ACKR1 protein, partial [Malurus elegans]|nr:ACKR1 protein [Malurus elegans]